jgi:hypothetical protein
MPSGVSQVLVAVGNLQRSVDEVMQNPVDYSDVFAY